MKAIELVIYFLFIFQITQNAYAQKRDSTEGPISTLMLQDMLENNKKQIQIIENKIDEMQGYTKVLNEFKEQIHKVTPNEIDGIYSRMNAILTQRNTPATLNAKMYVQEEELLTLIKPFSLGNFEFITFRSSEIVSNNFETNIKDLLKPINFSIISTIYRSHNRDNKSDATILNINDLQSLKNNISAASIKKTQTSIENSIAAEQKSNEDNLKSEQKNLQKEKDNRLKILSRQTESKDINVLAIYVGLPAFCLTILFLFLVPIFRNFDSVNSANSQATTMEISTVLLLTMSILILGLSDKIRSDVLGTLIGGISGYVLNRARTRGNGTT